jgi:hypothetical protein
LLKIIENAEAFGLEGMPPFPKISPEDKLKIVEWMMQLK